MTNNNDQNSIFNKYQIEIAQSLFNREIDKITDEATHNLSDLDHLKNYNDLCLRSEPIIDNIGFPLRRYIFSPDSLLALILSSLIAQNQF
jgi:hypothetical protein